MIRSLVTKSHKKVLSERCTEMKKTKQYKFVIDFSTTDSYDFHLK